MSLTTSLVSGAKPRTPKGSSRTAQGASPGFKGQIAESPERAAQGVRSQLQINARHKAPHLGTGTNCIAPSGLPLLLCLFPGLAPWAFLSRPCGASFAPETSSASITDQQSRNQKLGVLCVSSRLRGKGWVPTHHEDAKTRRSTMSFPPVEKSFFFFKQKTAYEIERNAGKNDKQ